MLLWATPRILSNDRTCTRRFRTRVNARTRRTRAHNSLHDCEISTLLVHPRITGSTFIGRLKKKICATRRPDYFFGRGSPASSCCLNLRRPLVPSGQWKKLKLLKSRVVRFTIRMKYEERSFVAACKNCRPQIKTLQGKRRIQIYSSLRRSAL